MTPPKSALIQLCSGLVAAIALLVQTAPPAAAAGWSLDKVFAERTAMRVADQRCKLFAPGVASALLMGEVQARNAVLRSGRDAADVARIVEIAVQRVRANSTSGGRIDVPADIRCGDLGHM